MYLVAVSCCVDSGQSEKNDTHRNPSPCSFISSSFLFFFSFFLFLLLMFFVCSWMVVYMVVCACHSTSVRQISNLTFLYKIILAVCSKWTHYNSPKTTKKNMCKILLNLLLSTMSVLAWQLTQLNYVRHALHAVRTSCQKTCILCIFFTSSNISNWWLHKQKKCSIVYFFFICLFALF